ncbi:stimulator of interferon genes protein isoform X2 [Cryptotermes secundus]|uniref:stimulator of interferon genes protein isoform X2 n=1 Tax=Cryptotermes secundus TaxID=105785 RepID=UPI000CD7BFFA|nr:stimulator of interferon genes protein isoform X2 [Cryptotermes secundus]
MYNVAREKSDGSRIQYPRGLPGDRGNRAQMCIAGFIAILLIIGGVVVNHKEGLGEVIMYEGLAVGVTTSVLLHVALRTFLLAEELHHIPGRYPDKLCAAWKAYTFNMKTLCTSSISAIVVLLIWTLFQNPYVYLWSKGLIAHNVCYLSGFYFSKLIQMEYSTVHVSVQIDKMNSLDYGSGMAYNFFYGYLRLVLPEFGTQSVKGIKKRIETFINKHRLSDSAFPVKKLFILIPKSLYIPTDLKDVSTDWPDDKCWMDAAMSLEDQVFDRAGVKQRLYKNSVYKIKNRDSPGAQPVYVVAEGATPLKTCYDVINGDPKMSRVFKDHQHDIILSFYKTLRDIIRDSDDCRDLCEIIYYVDTDDNKKRINVARIILERIQELTGRDPVQRH